MLNNLIDKIKKLRELTNMSFSLCKEAVIKTNSEAESIEYLKKNSSLNFDNISRKKTSNGQVKSYGLENFCFSIKVNCETDFVSKNHEFSFLLDKISFFIVENIKYLQKNTIYTYNEFIKDEFLMLNIKKILNESILLFKENIVFSDFVLFFGVCGYYNHSNNSVTSIAVLDIKDYNYEQDYKIVNELIKDISMQIAAMNPLYISSENISKEILEKERENILNSISKEKKNSKNMNFIISGKMNKFFNTFCLLEQNFIKDENILIKDLIIKYYNIINKTIIVSKIFRDYV